MREGGGALRTRKGRLRLGWRLVLFAAGVPVITGLLAALLPAGVVTASVAMLVGALGTGWALLAGDGRGPGALGFRLSAGAPREALVGLGSGVGLGLVVVGLMAVTGGLRWQGDPGSWSALWVAGAWSLAWLALPAAAEEAVVRGYAFQALAEEWGGVWAVLATSVLFGAMHLANPGATWLGAVNTAGAGAVLGVLVLRSGSLWLATGAHLGWNWAHGFLADTPVSGLDVVDTPLWDAVARGPSWLGGGPFGPEGSVMATLVFSAAIVACVHWGWPRPTAAARKTPPLFGLPRVVGRT